MSIQYPCLGESSCRAVIRNSCFGSGGIFHHAGSRKGNRKTGPKRVLAVG